MSKAPVPSDAQPPPAPAFTEWAALPEDALLLVDSAPLIYHLENNGDFSPRFAGLFDAVASGRLRMALTTVTLAEVLTGPYRHGRDALGKQIEAVLRDYEIHPLSASIAVQAARLRARYRLRLLDAIQLATALEIGAWALVTHNRDFSSVQDVRVLM